MKFEEQVLSELRKIDTSMALVTQSMRTMGKAIEDIEDEVKQISPLVRQHNQTLYGEDGKNGLKGEVKNIKADQKILHRFMWILTGIAVLGSSAWFMKFVLNLW